MSANNTEKKIWELHEYTNTETEIECTECFETETVDDEGYFAAREFYQRGWRVCGTEVCCKKCARKNNKK